MATKYTVVFTKEEREWLEEFTRRGRNSAAKIIQARALLLCDASEAGSAWPVVRITEALGLSSGTVNNLKKRVAESGLDEIFERRQRITPPREIVYGGNFEARVVALACSEPPTGFQRWTVRLLAEKIVELEIFPCASHMSVHRALKKMNYSLTEKSIGKSLPKKMPRS
jgi:hypothetical protein